MEIYLIRHTKPAVEEGVCYGQSDLPVAESFQEELSTLRRKIPAEFDAVFTSPLKRCVRLAKALKAAHYAEDKRLMELNFGAWEMQKWDTIDPAQMHQWMDDFVNTAPPAGESFYGLKLRVVDFWEELTGAPKARVALVAHAGVIRTLIAHTLELPLEKAFNFTVDYAKVSLVTFSEGVKRVRYVNA